ncbi:MAG: DUF4912 domain-containing protein [Chthoniobacterales bacterium]
MSNESAENTNGFRITSEPVVSNEYVEQESKYLPSVDPGTKPEFEHLGELPSGYDQMFLIARDPHWLFTYWDFDYSKFPAERQLYLQVFHQDVLEKTIEINEIARNWYIPVESADADYRVVFGLKDRAGTWQNIGQAGPTHTPPESVSPNWDTQFATVPFHLSFNFLLDLIAAARATGEPLTEALARLQQSAASKPGGPSSWGFDQIRILETLLGKDMVDRLFSLDSAQLAAFLKEELYSKLGSESASEILAKGRLAELLAPAESSLFSGSLRELLARELASGGVSSFGMAKVGGISSELLAGASETLASWQAGVREIISKWEQAVSSFGLTSETLASWQVGIREIVSKWQQAVSSYGLSSETLASWQAGLSEITSSWEKAISSYGESSESLASWQAGLGEITSSWETALSSLGLGSFALSSELLSSLSSWSGLEFGLSSWNQLVTESSLFSGVGASWSGQPFSLPEREFFMHVNAEVIFYGGTHPQAKVTIAGKPVQLQSDGTFRYHFKFPDNDFEIPVIAVAPDGLETRSATLSFRRATQRSGDVGATHQPAHLTEPMGAR